MLEEMDRQLFRQYSDAIVQRLRVYAKDKYDLEFSEELIKAITDYTQTAFETGYRLSESRYEGYTQWEAAGKP